MPTEAAFRLSTYLTLATACACLGYAESSTLPEVRLFAAASIASLVVLYRLETRVRLLSIPDANKLGAALALGWAGWTAFRVLHEIREPEFPGMGWQLLLVMLVGPLLMFLMPAKLARREKHVGDYWGLQGAGLAAVGLAGAIAEDGVCLALMAAYAVCGVWSLTLFFLARTTGAVPPIPHADRAAAPAEVPARAVAAGPPRPRAGGRELLRGLGWLGLALAAAAPLYLLTPRSTAPKLTFGEPRIEVGYAADQMIDLNKVGTLKANPDPAFEVTAETDDGRPKDDLNPDQRWRGVTLTHYDRGTWRVDLFPLQLVAVRTTSPQSWFAPDLGPGRYRLTFTVPYRVIRNGPPVLSDPVVWAPGRPAPAMTLEPGTPRSSWLQASDGSFAPPSLNLPIFQRGRGRTIKYVQVTSPQPDPDLGSGFELVADPGPALDRLTQNPVPRIKDYARQVLDRLVRQGRLPAAAGVAPEPYFVPRPEYHEAIAREFARYLARDAGLTYSLNLRREQKAMDPVEEFLFHSKTGHCERFASALVLMLRSQGVPAAMVLGFRGCESQGEGRYVVRQENAHAWAQALVSRPAPNGQGRVWHWLSVDPNPTGADETDPNGWIGSALSSGRSFIDEYIVHYSPEQRRKALEAIGGALTRPDVLAGAGVVLAAGLLVRRARRRAAARAASPPPSGPALWFGQLLAVLAPHGLAPGPGQTAREFASAAGAALRDRPGAAGVAGVPAEWAEAYYAARFGETPLSPDRKDELEARLADLRRALGG